MSMTVIASNPTFPGRMPSDGFSRTGNSAFASSLVVATATGPIALKKSLLAIAEVRC